MNFLEVLKFVLMIVETGALLGTLIFGTKGLRERKDRNLRNSLLTQALIYLVIFFVLSVLRNTYFN